VSGLTRDDEEEIAQQQPRENCPSSSNSERKQELRTFGRLPWHGNVAVDVLDVENEPALVVAQLGELRVEVEFVQRCRDADGRRALDLHQRYNHLVEHRQVHKRRLFDLCAR
jgi:hypothetical protein